MSEQGNVDAKSRPCQRCGRMIPPERIEVLPDTRLCVECSQAVGGEFDLAIVSGKPRQGREPEEELRLLQHAQDAQAAAATGLNVG